MSEIFDILFDCASIVIVVSIIMETLHVGPLAAIAIMTFWFFTRLARAEDGYFDPTDNDNFDDYLRTGQQAPKSKLQDFTQ